MRSTKREKVTRTSQKNCMQIKKNSFKRTHEYNAIEHKTRDKSLIKIYFCHWLLKSVCAREIYFIAWQGTPDIDDSFGEKYGPNWTIE